jgi:hypothetical protein
MLNEPALSGFTGNYRSDELDATYKVSLVKGALSLQIGTEAPVKMNPVASNKFEAEDRGTIVFQDTGNNHLSGLIFSSRRARGLTFQKVQ